MYLTQETCPLKNVLKWNIMPCLHGIDWLVYIFLITLCIKSFQMTTYDTPCVSSQPVIMSGPQLGESSSSGDTGQQVIHVHHLMFTSSVFKSLLMSAVVFFKHVNEYGMIIMRGIYYA